MNSSFFLARVAWLQRAARPLLPLMLCAVTLHCSAADRFGSRFRGIELKPALAKQPFTLESADGQPYAFAERTHGRVALLFFGYTHCPDICPVHLTNIAAALEKLSIEDRARIDVVFISTDPARDTPSRIREWLDNFNPAFVGLRGDRAAVNRIEALMNSAASVREPGVGGDTINYGVMHAAQVMAFTADDSMRVVYPFGIRQEDWVADLPRLLAFKPVAQP